MSDRRYALLKHTHAATAEANDLTAAVTWDDIPDANVPESSVTQHQAALTITESQISDLNHTASGMADLVDDLTPQLGGDLDLNTSDITGTGDISLTGSITSTLNIVSNKGHLSNGSAGAGTGLGPVAFMDYTGGSARFGAYDWDLGDWKDLDLTGENIDINANGTTIDFQIVGSNVAQCNASNWDMLVDVRVRDGKYLRVQSTDDATFLQMDNSTISNYAGMWFREGTPTASNYNIASNSSNLILNADGGSLLMRVSLTDVLSLTSTAITMAQHVTMTDDMTISTAIPLLKMQETDQAADEGFYDFRVQAGNFNLRTRTDLDGAGVTVFTVTRGTGTAVTSFDINQSMICKDTLDVDGVLTAGVTNIESTLTVTSAQPKFVMNDNNAITDEQNWMWRAQGGLIGLYTATDAAPTTLVNGGITFNRAGTTISTCGISATVITLTGNVAVTGTLSLAGPALDEVYGGTGETAVVTGDVLYGSGTNVWSRLAIGADDEVLTLASGVPTWAAAGGGGDGGIEKIKTANTTRTSTTTLADDNHLKDFVLAANTRYKVEGFLKVYCGFSSLADFKWIFTADNALVASAILMNGFDQAGTAEGDFAAATVGNILQIVTGQQMGICVSGFVKTHASLESNIDFQFAQGTSSTFGTILYANSWLKFTPLS